MPIAVTDLFGDYPEMVGLSEIESIFLKPMQQFVLNNCLGRLSYEMISDKYVGGPYITGLLFCSEHANICLHGNNCEECNCISFAIHRALDKSHAHLSGDNHNSKEYRNPKINSFTGGFENTLDYIIKFFQNEARKSSLRLPRYRLELISKILNDC